MFHHSRKALIKSYLGILLVLLVPIQISGGAEKSQSADYERDARHEATHFWRAVDGFLTALEKKEPGKFFEEAWALADKANSARFGKKAPQDPELAFGARQVSQNQRDRAAKMWGMLEKTVDLDATFEGYRDNKYSELGFTVEGLRGAMRMSKGFVLATEGKIALGLKDEKRGRYSYLNFRQDMINEFGFGEDQHPKTPVHHVARAGTRSRLTKALDAKLGEEKSEKFKRLLDRFFVEVAGAAIFAHAEASMQLAKSAQSEKASDSADQSE